MILHYDQSNLDTLYSNTRISYHARYTIEIGTGTLGKFPIYLSFHVLVLSVMNWLVLPGCLGCLGLIHS